MVCVCSSPSFVEVGRACETNVSITYNQGLNVPEVQCSHTSVELTQAHPYYIHCKLKPSKQFTGLQFNYTTLTLSFLVYRVADF